MRLFKKKRSGFQRLLDYISSSREAWIIATEIVIGILFSMSAVIVFMYFTDGMLAQSFHEFDITVSALAYEIRTSQLTSLMLFVSSFGDSVPFAATTLLCIILLLEKHKKEAMLFSIALISGVLLSYVLKVLIQRPRPEGLALITETTASFPSGHSMNAFVFFSLLAFFSFHFFRNKRLTLGITLASVICVILVGFSRIYLGVHYATDVLAGYLAGFWWFVTVLVVDRTLIFYKLYKRSE